MGWGWVGDGTGIEWGWDGTEMLIQPAWLWSSCIPPHKGPSVCPISAIITNQLVSYGEQTSKRSPDRALPGTAWPQTPCPPSLGSTGLSGLPLVVYWG